MNTLKASYTITEIVVSIVCSILLKLKIEATCVRYIKRKINYDKKGKYVESQFNSLGAIFQHFSNFFKNSSTSVLSYWQYTK